MQPKRSYCKSCGGWAVYGSTCPKTIACPTCPAGYGQSCKRPSGHRAANVHASRCAAAEAIDAVQGITYGQAA
jgi:hypothetical protein